MNRIRGAKKALYTAYMLFFGSGQISRRYRYLYRWQTSDEEFRRRERDRIFRHLFQFAFERVPFYTKLYLREGLKPADIRSLKDMDKIPLVSREMLKMADPSDLKPRGSFLYPLVSRFTSGSSGQPLQFYKSLDGLLFNAAQFLIYLDMWGLSDTRRVFFALFNTDPTTSINFPYSWHLSIYNKNHSVHPEDNVAEVARKILEGQPDLVVTYPSVLERLCDYLLEAGGECPRKMMFATGGETQSPALIRKIKAIFPEGDIFNIYNTEEAGMIAVECPYHQGMHVNNFAVVLEKGESVSIGEEMTFKPIITNLRKYGTPFIRYTGIEDTLFEASVPYCHSHLGAQAIKKIEGRISDFIYTSDGSSYPVIFLMDVHSSIEGIHRFQYKQTSPQEFTICYVAKKGADELDLNNQIEASSRKILGNNHCCPK